MFQAKNLSFYYKEKLVFSDVHFTLPQGSITGLVGSNGAGKTTLMRCMAGLYQPHSGTVSINEIDIHQLPHQAHQKMGYLSDSFGLYPNLTVRQSLEYTALLFSINIDILQERITDVLSKVSLMEQQSQQTQTLSRGQRQRLGIAQAIIHQPDFLLLDEPASGLDPQARIELSTLLKNLQKSGMTILVSSHILAELDEYCTHLMILQNQKIVEFTSLHEIYQNNNQNKQSNIGIENQLQKMQISILNDVAGLENELIHQMSILNSRLGLDSDFDLSFASNSNLDNNANNINNTNNEIQKYSFNWLANESEKQKLLKSLIEKNYPIAEFKAVHENLQERYLKQIKN